MSNLAMTASLPHGRKALRGLICLLFTLLAFAGGPAVAATFAVNSVADARDANAGDSICATASGVCSLRAAIEETNALPGADSITLTSSTYLITLGNGDDKAERGDFDVTDVLRINGSGPAFTVIDGNANDRVFDVHENASLDMSAVTVQNGNINKEGGGIRSEGTLTLTNVTFSDNVGKDGGGVYVRKNASIATLSNVLFDGNSANKGGGLYAKDNSTVRIADSTFRANFGNTSGVETKDGGGAYIDKANVTIVRSVFEENNAEKGGGLYAKNNATISITNSTFDSNSVTKEGGGAYFDKLIARISGTTFSGNSAEEGGGLFLKGGATDVALTNVTLSGNSSTKEGGGIHKEGNGALRLTNVTVNNNSSPRGGGLRHKDGTLSLFNTLAANSPQGSDCDGTITSLGNNLDGDGSCQLGQASDLSNTDPLLGPLQDNGGSTLTHDLTDFSPARDAGSNSGCPATDQRDVLRPVDSNADSVAICDIGALEAGLLYPDYNLNKAVVTLTDPYSGGANPKAIPGAIMQYTISLGNDGPGAADQNSMEILEAVPLNTSLVVVDFDVSNPGPVAFVDGIPVSGLSYNFVDLTSTVDDIEFSNDGGATYSYTPVPAADGSDSNVTHVRIIPTGFAQFTGADPVAEFLLKVVIQ